MGPSDYEDMTKNAVHKAAIYELNERITSLMVYGLDRQDSQETMVKAVVELFTNVNSKHKLFKQ